MNMKFPIMIISVLICAVMLIALTPMFISITTHSEIRTNDNVGWARFNYSTGTTANISVQIEDDVLSLGGPAPQNGPVDDMIIWADNNLSIYIKNGTAYYIGNNGGSVTTGSLSNDFTISKLSNAVRIIDGGNTYNFPVSSWAFIPNANGGYGCFLGGQDSYLNDENINRAFVGDLLDIYAYNNINSGNYTLYFYVDKNDNVISGGSWSGGVENE